MKYPPFLPALVAAALATTPVVADDAARPGSATTQSVKNRPPARPAKPAAPAAPPDAMETIDFSRPYESPVGPKPTKPISSPESRTAPKAPEGGASFDLKWRATNDKIDPYDAVRHTSGSNGPGDAVEGGLKVGF